MITHKSPAVEIAAMELQSRLSSANSQPAQAGFAVAAALALSNAEVPALSNAKRLHSPGSEIWVITRHL